MAVKKLNCRSLFPNFTNAVIVSVNISIQFKQQDKFGVYDKLPFFQRMKILFGDNELKPSYCEA